MVLGLVLGIALAIIDKVAPSSLKAWVPPASGLGIAMVLPGSNSISPTSHHVNARRLSLWRGHARLISIESKVQAESMKLSQMI